ncbi:MAG: EAL domain-containing response regulator [Gammaproteobacteria bacterium]|nr:EAL domain-containing response regulator [Gammaproteobacteria bacterium]
MSEDELKRLKALIVDDDPFMRQLLAMTLQQLEIGQIVSAHSGENALAILDAAPAGFDVLLCDLKMPGMDGVEFLRHLSEREYAGGVILMSGEELSILRAAVNLGRARFLNILGSLEKPITAQALLHLLADLKPQPKSTAGHSAVSLLTVEEFRQGLGRGELCLYYQPQVELTTRRVIGVEALARWQHPERGLIGPAAFVPLAEANNTVDEFSEQVFRLAIAQTGRWLEQGLDMRMSINLSTAGLNRIDLPEVFERIVKASRVDISRIMLELTESRLMKNVATSLEILTRLRLKGFGLSIDDFGTGYSTLEQLKRVPFIELKIDRSFVHGAVHDPSACAILETSASLAKHLGLSIVAEGVEDMQDWAQIAALDCEYAQGYFIAKPMPGEEFPRWLQTWRQSA